MKRKSILFLVLILLLSTLLVGCTTSVDCHAQILENGDLRIEINHSKDSSQVYQYKMDPENGLTCADENSSSVQSLFALLTGHSAKYTYIFRPVSDGKTRITISKFHPNTPDLVYTVANFDVYVEKGKIEKCNEVIILGED